MISKKSVFILAIVLTTISLTTLLQVVPLASSTSSEWTNQYSWFWDKPTLSVRVDKRVISDGETFMAFLYVKNPSTNLETEADQPLYPIHKVTVSIVNVKFVNPAGVIIDEQTFDPIFRPARWDTNVYPLENSLVFWVGWGGGLGDPGIYTLVFTVTVTFEGQTFNLVNKVWMIQT
jgi:hypothetical protein